MPDPGPYTNREQALLHGLLAAHRLASAGEHQAAAELGEVVVTAFFGRDTDAP